VHSCDAHSCYMCTTIKHPVPDRVKPSLLDVKNYKLWLNPVWHRMLYSCIHYPYGNSGRQRVNIFCNLWCSIYLVLLLCV